MAKVIPFRRPSEPPRSDLVPQHVRDALAALHWRHLLSDWEAEFLESVRGYPRATDRQRATLTAICAKVARARMKGA